MDVQLASFADDEQSRRDGLPSKHISKCSGCHYSAADHDFGPVGPYCSGPAKLLPCNTDVFGARPRTTTSKTGYKVRIDVRPTSENSDVELDESEDVEFLKLQEQFHKLQIRENNVRRQAITADLKRQFDEKEMLIASLKECAYSVNQSSTNATVSNRNSASMLNVEKKTYSQSFTAKDARKMFPQSLETPLDAILSNPGKIASGFGVKQIVLQQMSLLVIGGITLLNQYLTLHVKLLVIIEKIDQSPLTELMHTHSC